jgi:lysophospholipase L1-like esterase
MAAVRRRSFAKRIVFASIPLLLILATLETAVRVFGLDQSCPGEYGERSVWACDPVLGFKLKPGLMPAGQPLNRAGFRSREFEPKRAGVLRILALGDSCTYGILSAPEWTFYHIPEPYPQLLERFAAERLGSGKLEVLNAGVPGYTSFHGVMLLRSKLRGLEPDVITVRYGWNDHFVQVLPSTASYREPQNAFVLGVQDLLLRTSLYGFFRRLGLEIQARGEGRGQATPTFELPSEWSPSIPGQVYRHNLRRIVALGRAQGARVWLLTSPHAFVVDANQGRYGDFPMSAQQLLQFNGIPSFERLIEIHDDYNQALREVASELGAPVVDMDAVYRAHAGASLFLQSDVPHPTAVGHALEASTLYERLLAEGLVKPAGRTSR